jgi:hypothetical protein
MLAAVSLAPLTKNLPTHKYASQHHLLRAAKKYGGARRLRAAESLTPSGEVACQRIREFAYDLGAETEWAHGWKAAAARALGLSYSTMWSILMRDITTIGTRTVDHVARTSGIPVSVFYDPEV